MPPAEHPFAQYVRILGKGPRLSRHLTEEEALAASRLLMAGEVEPIQLGAFLCLLRVRSENEDELAGLVRAARETMVVPQDAPKVDLDWPSYAGKRARLPWFLLTALLLARNGVRVFMHGQGEHTAGRLYTESALTTLGFPPSRTLDEAAAQLAARNFTYLPLEKLSPRLHDLMTLKPLLGVRSPIHTAVRALNPFEAPCQIIGVAHPPYRALHQSTARVLGQKHMACFKGDGGEAERRPEKSCDVAWAESGSLSEESWAPLLDQSVLVKDEVMESERMRALWNGELTDPVAEAVIAGTAAIALKLLGRATTQDDAQTLAWNYWRERDRKNLGAA